jgi:predicted amidohydrolase YtcJ
MVASASAPKVDLVLVNGNVATQDARRSLTTALAVREGRIVAVGSEAEEFAKGGRAAKVIDAAGRTVIPGLTDTHLHFIREGLQYHAELRWDGVPTLREALDRLRVQAARTPAGAWVRVVGGWSEFQFEERRVPTQAELNAASANVPALVLHVYHDAMLNPAGLTQQAIGPSTLPPAYGEIEHDAAGTPTGSLVAKPNATILYGAVAGMPKLARAEQVNSTLHFGREMNRLGVTSVVDAGGGSQLFPDDYSVISEVARTGQLTVRVSYNLYPQRPGHELEDFTQWAKTHSPGEGDAMLRINGAGENLVYTGADYENFQEERPHLDPQMESQLGAVVRFLVQHRWPFRLHASYDESIERFLNVFEEVNDQYPMRDLRWFFDHAETISDKNLDRVHQLGGGIAVQDRIAFQGEQFVRRYGAAAAAEAPPIAKMIAKGIPTSGGTDATRVASYNPWVSIQWMIEGKTLGGETLAKSSNLLSRMEALRMMTANSPWFSWEEGTKGSLEVGRAADFAVLSADYFSVPVEQIRRIESVLTVVGGRVVYAAGPFAREAPPPLPAIIPTWSPTAFWGSGAASSTGGNPAAAPTG